MKTKTKKIVEVKVVGKMLLPATRSAKIVYGSDCKTQEEVVYEIDGEKYVEISRNTHGSREFTLLSDLIVGDGVLKSAHYPLELKWDQIKFDRPHPILSTLESLPPISVPERKL